MQTPPEISFTNLEPSDAVKGRVHAYLEDLEKITDEITSAHVFIEMPHRQHVHGNRYDVRLEVRVPGTELAVNNKPGDDETHRDLEIALRDSFRAMERQLKRWKRQRREPGEGTGRPPGDGT